MITDFFKNALILFNVFIKNKKKYFLLKYTVFSNVTDFSNITFFIYCLDKTDRFCFAIQPKVAHPSSQSDYQKLTRGRIIPNAGLTVFWRDF